MDLELLKERAAILRNIRAYFDKKNYLEVDTPILSPDLIPESCLEVFQTERLAAINSRNGQGKPYWLVPSPEIWMKKLIAKHKTNMYQICKCFRNRESSGFMHSPEFTMLEYYTMNVDYKDSLLITEDIFDNLLCKADPAFCSAENYKTLAPPFVRLTMDEAFVNCAGFSLNEALEKNTLYEEACKCGISVPKETSNAVLYDLVFIHIVEPNLPKEKPAAILDYPEIVPCLAALNENTAHNAKTRQRWELYVHGIEIANCFSEETDPIAVKDFFENEAVAKKTGFQIAHNIDENYWQIFKNFPRSSGVAMGLDRLIMAITGRKTIDSVLPFPMED
ncbi:MAG: LysR family transcriptional regulator [Spirochaetaceae bacterium]|nr:LysR family transcriptional regulator [Spirochaetaceae bacterium]